jgi:Mat/Ecp fimbriae outer membrane usher protein
MSYVKYTKVLLIIVMIPLAWSAPPEKDEQKEIETLVQSWLLAWRDKDLDSYQRLYTNEFATPQWLKGRKRVFAKAGKIQLTISKQEIAIKAKGRANVSFHQTYQADTYADDVEKILVLEKRGLEWKISNESSIPSFCHCTVSSSASVSQPSPAPSLPEPVAPLAPAPLSPNTGRRSSRTHYSSGVKAVFEQGVDLTVFVRNRDADSLQGEATEIGKLTVKMENDVLQFVDFVAKQELNGTVLSPEILRALGQLKGAEFDADSSLKVSDDADLLLNPITLEATLFVNASAFGVQARKRDGVLEAASVRGLSGVFNYDINGFSSNSYGESSRSAYANFDSYTSWGEHHINFAGSVYSGGESESQDRVNIDRLMYERDMNGQRLALGMLDGWAMQSLGSTSALNSDRMYGFSYGSSTNSLVQDHEQSLTPLQVYLPAAGEARVMRDGRVISVQRLAMGNHELDTSSFPSGVYDVKVDVLVAGKTTSTRTFRVNKPNGKTNAEGLQWQVWGGTAKRSESYSEGSENDEYVGLAGTSIAGQWGDVSMNSSLYMRGSVFAEEAEVSWDAWEGLRFNLQNIYASDATRRFATAVNWDVPGSMLSLWANYERGRDGRELEFWSRDYENIGGNLNLSTLSPNLGTLTLSYERDHSSEGSKTMTSNYNQQIYSGQYGSAQLQVGFNRTQNAGQQAETEKYISLNLSLPLNSDFSLGVSHDKNGSTLDVDGGVGLDGQAIKYIGGNISQGLSGENKDTNYGAYANYDMRYGSGTINYQGSRDSNSISLSNHGNLVWNSEQIAAGSGTGESAMIVDVPIEEDDALEADVNGQKIPLKSGRNVISVPGYSKNKLEIRSNAEKLGSESTFLVDSTAEEYVLYPGNVSHLQVDAQKMITVFGRLNDDHGQPVPNAKIKNHIGFTSTDAKGQFAIDVNKDIPELKVESDKTGPFSIVMDFDDKKNRLGVISLGDISWDGSKKMKVHYPLKPDLSSEESKNI